MYEAGQTVADAIIKAAARFQNAGIDEPRREAASLAAYVLGKDAVFLIAHPEYILSHHETDRYESVVTRREGREPYHYITGTKEFYGLDFTVAPGVLIPRPETELLVAEAIQFLSDITLPSLFEIGIGSGCIAISILCHAKHVRAEAVDVSSSAISIAKGNATHHQVADRLQIRTGDVFNGTTGEFDLIVSNPPYIPTGDLASTQAEVGGFEPHIALFAGADGLSVIRRIVDEAPVFLRPQGLLLIEIGFGQSVFVKELFDKTIWDDVEFIVDLQGIERIVKARMR